MNEYDILGIQYCIVRNIEYHIIIISIALTSFCENFKKLTRSGVSRFLFAYRHPFPDERGTFHIHNRTELSHHQFRIWRYLLVERYIEELDYRPYRCNPLTVVKGRKLRLVIDPRHVNAFCSVLFSQVPRLGTAPTGGRSRRLFHKFWSNRWVSSRFNTTGTPPIFRFRLWSGRGTGHHSFFIESSFGLCTACYFFWKN